MTCGGPRRGEAIALHCDCVPLLASVVAVGVVVWADLACTIDAEDIRMAFEVMLPPANEILFLGLAHLGVLQVFCCVIPLLLAEAGIFDGILNRERQGCSGPMDPLRTRSL